MQKKPVRKRKPGGGAKKGNKNALRHGFYSKDFTTDQKKRLDDSDSIDVLAEINLIKVCIDKLKEEISFDEITRSDNNGTTYRDSHYLSQLNTLAIMTGSIATLVRTHYLTHGKNGDIQSSILEALEQIRLEMGI